MPMTKHMDHHTARPECCLTTYTHVQTGETELHTGVSMVQQLCHLDQLKHEGALLLDVG